MAWHQTCCAQQISALRSCRKAFDAVVIMLFCSCDALLFESVRCLESLLLEEGPDSSQSQRV